MELLLGRDDIDVNSRSNSGRTPLSWAAERGREAVVRLLLDRGDVDVNSKDTGYRPDATVVGSGDRAGGSGAAAA